LLCLGWPFCMLEVCDSSLLWRLFDELLLITVTWSQEFSGVLKFWI